MRDPFLKLILAFIFFMIYGLVIMFVLVNVTDPFLASILPSALAYGPIVMVDKANMFPLNEV